MKCLLLAAGRGTRIAKYIPDCPKCTVDIGGIPLINYSMSVLKEEGVKDVALSVGYLHKIVEEKLKNDDCKFFFNPFYEITNSIASAWFAKDFIDGDDDLIIMNADVYLEKALWKKLLSGELSKNVDSPVVILMDSSKIIDADYKFKVKDGYLEKYGKELTPEETSGEYVGIAIIKKSFIKTFINKLNEMIEDKKYSVWWENVLYELSDKMPIPVVDVAGSFWAEVDFIEDYNKILNFHKNIK